MKFLIEKGLNDENQADNGKYYIPYGYGLQEEIYRLGECSE